MVLAALIVAIGFAATPLASSTLAGPDDLAKQYYKIFPSGNRNAASHLWASYIVNHSASMSESALEDTFTGFCPISGSPLPDNPRTAYKVTLPRVNGGVTTGVTHHCCWPCVCDLTDYVRVDTMSITTAEGAKTYDVLVLGDPCAHPKKLSQSYQDPFSGEPTLLADSAPELACINDNGQKKLLGAKYSNHGYPVIGLFFTKQADLDQVSHPPMVPGSDDPTFGYGKMCSAREKDGYNSGMGLIFHLVAAINPISNSPALAMPSADIQGKSDQLPKNALPAETASVASFGAATVSMVALAGLGMVFALRVRRHVPDNSAAEHYAEVE